MAVVGEIRRAEDHAPIEDRKHAAFALCHLAVPELEMTSVLLFPLAIQIDDDVEATVELQLLVPVEICVDLEEAAGHNLVQTAALIVGIGNEALDPGKRFQELEEDGGIEVRREQVARERSK